MSNCAFIQLKEFDDYEIMNEYPFKIRNKKTKAIIEETLNKTLGYYVVTLNNKTYYHHRIIANQFLENNDPNKTQIDHINHQRTDNHLENLRWVTPSENCRNKSSTKNIVYEYVNEISEEAMKVDSYGDHSFTNYYFIDDVFYFYTGVNYKKLHINENKYGSKFVVMIDDDHKQVNVFYSKFKEFNDLI